MLRGQFIVAAAAIYLLLVGALCLFLPEKVGAQFGAGANAPLLLIQVLGSACLGLGLLDWVSRHSMVGGIYGRPLVIGNLVHFVCGALVFARSLMDAQTAMTGSAWQCIQCSLSRLGLCCSVAGYRMLHLSSKTNRSLTLRKELCDVPLHRN